MPIGSGIFHGAATRHGDRDVAIFRNSQTGSALVPVRIRGGAMSGPKLSSVFRGVLDCENVFHIRVAASSNAARHRDPRDKQVTVGVATDGGELALNLILPEYSAICGREFSR